MKETLRIRAIGEPKQVGKFIKLIQAIYETTTIALNFTTYPSQKPGHIRTYITVIEIE